MLGRGVGDLATTEVEAERFLMTFFLGNSLGATKVLYAQYPGNAINASTKGYKSRLLVVVHVADKKKSYGTDQRAVQSRKDQAIKQGLQLDVKP